MTDHVVSLETLYARFDAIARARSRGSSPAAHQAVLDRLAVNQRAAEARGWTSCTRERVAGMGRLRAWGVAPGSSERRPIPDWPTELA